MFCFRGFSEYLVSPIWHQTQKVKSQALVVLFAHQPFGSQPRKSGKSIPICISAKRKVSATENSNVVNEKSWNLAFCGRNVLRNPIKSIYS
jgi:hypothetical protein